MGDATDGVAPAPPAPEAPNAPEQALENDDSSVLTRIQREMRTLLREYLDGLHRVDEASTGDTEGASGAINAEAQELGAKLRRRFEELSRLTEQIPGRDRSEQEQAERIAELRRQDDEVTGQLREIVAEAERVHARGAARANAITEIALAQAENAAREVAQ